MYSPNPIILGQTPPAGVVLVVTDRRGGMAGYILLSQSGPALTVELGGPGAWFVPDLPYTLEAGEVLRLTRADPSPVLSTLHALMPLDEGGEPEPEPGLDPLTVTVDGQGYQTITNADATTNAGGYQTIPDATATAAPDGYESVERTTP